MAKNEKTSKKVRAIAGRVLATRRWSDHDVMVLAASALSQSPDVIEAMIVAHEGENVRVKRTMRAERARDDAYRA